MYQGITVGIDMGDKKDRVCVLDREGAVKARASIMNTAQGIRKYFKQLGRCRVVIEAGTHSGWVSRILEEMGHEVLVGNPRKLRMIWNSDAKDDERDAEMLARIGRLDPQLLYPIHHRGQQAQTDLAMIKARGMLVKSRSMLIAHARGLVKSMGQRISQCGAAAFHRRLKEEMPEELMPALEPVMKSIEELTARIRDYDRQLEQLGRDKYPETQGLRAIQGVGPLTSLAFVLTLEDCARFDKSRSVGAYLGLTRKRDQSGETDKQLGITRAGDEHLRSLLVQAAHYLLGPFASDCELRAFGLRLAERGGKNGKRRAVVAVARKLAVLMHHLWKSGAAYDPYYHQNQKKKAA